MISPSTAASRITSLMIKDGFSPIQVGSLDWTPLINYIESLRAEFKSSDIVKSPDLEILSAPEPACCDDVSVHVHDRRLEFKDGDLMFVNGVKFVSSAEAVAWGNKVCTGRVGDPPTPLETNVSLQIEIDSLREELVYWELLETRRWLKERLAELSNTTK